jgi:hypothetical protein
MATIAKVTTFAGVFMHPDHRHFNHNFLPRPCYISHVFKKKKRKKNCPHQTAQGLLISWQQKALIPTIALFGQWIIA